MFRWLDQQHDLLAGRLPPTGKKTPGKKERHTDDVNNRRHFMLEAEITGGLEHFDSSGSCHEPE